MDVENGLAPAEVTVARDRVQILTVHAAKGLEWQVVAVPHLVGRVFPSTASARTWLTDAADLPPLLRGDRATVSEHGVPVLDTSDVNDRKALSDKIAAHRKPLDQRRIDEERRLLYVAHHPRRGHAGAVGPPLGRHRDQAPRARRTSCSRSRTSSIGRRPRAIPAAWSSSGRPAPADGEPKSVARQRDRSDLARRPAGARRG